eukprot:CAMPEP_0181032466 /NCGR_PEP_ID=MMETSP1070-20121207/6757_1 /TAXON_ID=265543 /ORGANISM="Minutocellus polymorphus, Strain NH13" /LENGTH=686 /DNA_ID=CAMNT_0023109865 /DNA_START=81 /DNA_END=2141 /DNA_ORIENTATION=-
MNSAGACGGGGGGSGLLGVRRKQQNRPAAASGMLANNATGGAVTSTRVPPKSAFGPLKATAGSIVVPAAPGGPEPANNDTTTSHCSNAANDSLCANTAQQTAQQAAQQQQQLARALAELDRERTKRAEAETRCATLGFDARRLRSDVIILRRQRDAFVDMVEALTADSCDAVRYAAAARSGSEREEQESALSLHDIRLLEIMPWDERARNITEVVEEVYEWQVGDGGGAEGQWTNRTEMFPADFRALPVHRPGAGATNGGGGGGDDIMSSQQAQTFKGFVLTDRHCTRILDLEGGYPLPTAGSTWRWIGGWRVELQHPCGTPCDEGGWTYCNLPQLLVSNAPGAVYGSPTPPSLRDAGEIDASASNDSPNPGNTSIPPPKLQFRRRRWTRLRILVSYPSMSARTEACLDLLAENAILDLKTAKMEDYAHRMVDVARNKEDANRKLRRRLRSTEAALKALEQEKVDATIDSRDVTQKDGATTSTSRNPISTTAADTTSRGYVSSQSQDTTYSTDPPSSEDEADTKAGTTSSSTVSFCATSVSRSTSEGSNGTNSSATSQAGISMHPLTAKSIAKKACQDSAATPNPLGGHSVNGVINGARRSLDEYGGAFFGRMLRPMVPSELRGGLGKLQIGENGKTNENLGSSNEGSGCSSTYAWRGNNNEPNSDCEEGEPFRIPGGAGSPTVSY